MRVPLIAACSVSLAISAAVSGCAGFSGETAVPVALIKARTGVDVSAERSEQILASTLDADSATQIALRNNPGLQAAYLDAGIAEADMVQAGLPHNPGFTFNHTEGGAGTVIDRTWSLSLLSLFTARLAGQIERSRFEQVKLQVADAALRVATETRIAYFEALGAQQNLLFAQQVNEAAAASASLADDMLKNGNWSELEQQREHLFYEQAKANLVMAQTGNAAKRESLTQLLGLPGNLSYRLPDQLPELPEQPFVADEIEALAMAQRLDIKASVLDTQRVAAALDLTRATGFINVLDAGPALNSTSGQTSARGYAISVEIPLFDWGQAKSRKAEAQYMQAVQRAAETALHARSEVRLAYQTYQHSYQLARQYRDQILPLQKKISAQNLLRYNGMLISVFELLVDARSQIATVNDCNDALKNFWVADTRLQSALGGRLPSSGDTP